MECTTQLVQQGHTVVSFEKQNEDREGYDLMIIVDSNNFVSNRGNCKFLPKMVAV